MVFGGLFDKFKRGLTLRLTYERGQWPCLKAMALSTDSRQHSSSSSSEKPAAWLREPAPAGSDSCDNREAEYSEWLFP